MITMNTSVLRQGSTKPGKVEHCRLGLGSILDVGSGLLIDVACFTPGSSSSAGTLGLDLQVDDGSNDDKPVNAVASDGSNRGNVVPSNDRVAEGSKTFVGIVRVAVIQSPNVGTRIKGSSIVSISTNNLVPLVHFIGIDGLREEASSNQQQEASGANKETVKSQLVSSLVDDESD